MLPEKLKIDSIAEAVCEIRFDSEEVPELILGKLAAIDVWKGYEAQRLPIADMPATMRINDPHLRHQAIMQLTSEEDNRIVRLGTNMLAYNNIGKYAGWDAYYTDIKRVTKALFEAIPNIKITRLGLRYINALNKGDHRISSINDLKMRVEVGDEVLTDNINLNYKKVFKDSHEVFVRLSTPSLLKQVDVDLNVLVDLDLYSQDVSNLQELDGVNKWIDEAHTFEKKEFFSLFPEDVLTEIVEK